MTPEEYDRALTKTISDLSSQPRGEIMQSLGTVALTLIKQRVQETGTDADGKRYNPYSTRPMLANRGGMTVSAYNQIAGSKDKRKELKWVTLDGHKLFEVPGGYKQYRELHGRQTGFVDFSFSGRMWSNITLISSPADHNSGIAIIGTKDPKINDIIEGNTKRRGDILDLSKKEISRRGGLDTMTTPKTNKQTKLDQIRASLKRARIGHHLKIASITASTPQL